MSDHTAGAFDRELDKLGRRIAEMGGIASRMVSDAVLALSNADSGLALAVVGSDPRLDALQHEVDEQAVLTIARRQPVAQDLREIIGAMRVAGALERVGDLAKSIALRAMMVDPDRRPAHTTAQIRQMSEVAVAILTDVLEAYVTRDADRAERVSSRDAELGELAHSIFLDLLTRMTERPRSITTCVHLLFCSRNIEGIGDHASGIAESVRYALVGEGTGPARAEPN